MIKIVKLEGAGEYRLRLTFSDGRTGIWDARPLLTSRATPLTTPLLEDKAQFARAFVESGALAWPNGLELAPWSLWEELNAAGALERQAA